ncbi:hypothetical protein [Clostridium ljungdahlii]|uniref:Uncharacterized protein n=1 Tax=Clostridium ljungdahlii TaxID=1538 RepID=A0A168PIS2_9CLOT|nr:hypothetical protein [Clostridium ljungdahlii]OAA87795.1 hypothetical protein WY13_01910 [Clostridium ljungdahlii]
MKLANVDTNGNIYLNIGFIFSEYKNHLENILVDYIKKEDECGKYLTEKMRKKRFDKVQEVNELLTWEENRRENLKKLEEKYQPFIDERDKREEEFRKERERVEEIRREQSLREREEEDKRLKIKEENERKEELKELEKEKKKEEAFGQERDKWIAAYGSQYLKQAIKLKYDVDSKYVIERAKKEFPDYDCDINDNAGWSECCNPTEKSIEEVVKLIENGNEAEIVWLTNPADSDYQDDFQEREAIAIINYLGKYDLIKSIKY